MASQQRLRLITAVCFLLLLQSPASKAISLTESYFFSEIPVTFTATRLPQQLQQAPASVTIIDRSLIEASSAMTVTEALRLVPGMQAYFTAGNTAAAAYHGVSNKFPPRMEVMINGRSVYIPLFSTVLWDALPITLAEIERIEVIRGTNTVTQGSNAFLGAINIITGNALTDSADNTIRLSAGSFDSRHIEARHNNQHNWGYHSLSAGLLSNDGQTYHNGDRDPYSNRYMNFRTTLTPNLSNTLSLELGYTRGFTTVGDIDLELSLNKREQESHYQSLKWDRILSDNTSFALHYSHSYIRLDGENLTTGYIRDTLGTDPLARILNLTPDDFARQLLDANNPSRASGEVGDTQVHDIELSFQHQLSDRQTLLAGAGYQLDRARSRELLDTQDWVSDERWRLFGHWENREIPRWQFNNGVMIEQAGNGTSRVSPRFALNHQWSEEATIRTSIARAYRMPSLLERHLQTVVYNPAILTPLFGEIFEINSLSNPQLRPEQIDSFDIGYLQRWPQQHSNIDIRLFYEQIRDGIGTTFLALDNPIIQPGGADLRYRTEANRSDWYNYGMDLQYRFQPDGGFMPLFLLSYGYIETRGKRNYGQQGGPDSADKIDDLADRNPTHTLTAVADFKLRDNWKFSVTHHYLSQVRWLEGSGSVANKPYHRTDLKLSRQLHLPADEALRLSVTAQNINDSVASEFYSHNPFGRRFYVQLEWQF